MSLKVAKYYRWLRRTTCTMGIVAGSSLLLTRMAAADTLNGFLEWNYATADTAGTDSAGVTTRSKSDSFYHRYSLNAQKSLFPNLSLTGGGLFDQQISKVTDEKGDFEGRLTKISPYAGLTLANSYGNGGINYNRREEEASGSGASANVNETYSLNVQVRERGKIPPLNLFLTRSNTFDKARVSQDLTTDTFSFGSRYRLFSSLDLSYQGLYTDATNRLNGLEVTTLSHNGRGSYSRQFFDNRISLATTYSVVQQGTRTSFTEKGGEVYLQLFPFTAYSALSDTPQVVESSPNAALIDGDLTVGTGLNIGIPPLGSDSRPRNMGVDLVTPAEVNTLRVWVSQALPPQVAARFSWSVYVSADNLDWTLVQTIPSAPFGQFENRFEIGFLPVTARYVKVVTSPLTVGGALPPPGVDLSAITITEVQAFLRKPADAVTERETSTTSHLYSLNTRTKLLAGKPLYYDMNLTYNQSSSGDSSSSRYIVSNALNYSHVFNRIFSGSARAGREDSQEATGNRVGYVYGASLSATPLPTLNHTLVYSGVSENIAGKSKWSNAVFLNNYAELYRGVNLSLSGGLSMAVSETGQTNNNATVSMGTILVPLPSLSVNLNYSGTSSSVSGGGKPALSTYTQRGETSVSFNPFRSVYLFGSVAVSAERRKEAVITETFGGTWSPFRDGALQFNLAYSESLSSLSDQKDRSIAPALRWNIRGGSFLMISYVNTQSESTIQKAEIHSVSAGLRISF